MNASGSDAVSHSDGGDAGWTSSGSGSSSGGDLCDKAIGNPSKVAAVEAAAGMLATALGPAAICGPYAVARAGWAGLAVYMGVGVVLVHTATLFARLQHACGVSEPLQVVEACLGPRAAIIARSLRVLELFLVCCAFMTIGSRNLAMLQPFARLFDGVATLSPASSTMIIAAIVLPTLWLRRSTVPAKLAWLVVAALFFYPIIYCIEALRMPERQYVALVPVEAVIPSGLASCAGLSAVAFSVHAAAESGPYEVRDSKVGVELVRRTGKATLMVYFVLLCGGIFAFGGSVGPLSSGSLTVVWQRRVAALGLVAVVIAKLGLALDPLARSVGAPPEADRGSHAYYTTGAHIVVRSALLVGVALVSQTLPPLAYTLSLVGGTLTMCNCVLFPVLCFLSRRSEERLLCAAILIGASAVALGVIVCDPYNGELW